MIKRADLDGKIIAEGDVVGLHINLAHSPGIYKDLLIKGIVTLTSDGKAVVISESSRELLAYLDDDSLEFEILNK